MSYDKVKFFDPKGLARLAQLHLGKFIVRVSKRGFDYKGNKFKAYSKGYSDLIGRKFQKKDGSRLKAYRGFPVGGKTTDPKLELRGLTMADLKVREVMTDHWVIGWRGEFAEIIQGNKEKGRNVVDDLPPDEWNYILEGLGKMVDREFKKIPDITVIKA